MWTVTISGKNNIQSRKENAMTYLCTV